MRHFLLVSFFPTKDLFFKLMWSVKEYRGEFRVIFDIEMTWEKYPNRPEFTPIFQAQLSPIVIMNNMAASQASYLHTSVQISPTNMLERCLCVNITGKNSLFLNIDEMLCIHSFTFTCGLSCRWRRWPCALPAGWSDSWLFWTLWYIWESTSLQGMLQDPVSRGVGYPAFFVCSTTAFTLKTLGGLWRNVSKYIKGHTGKMTS